MILNKYFLGIFFTANSVLNLFSQETKPLVRQDSFEILNEVLITATRTKRQLSSLPLPAQIINKKTIEQSGSMRLGDILAEQTGLITLPDFGGGEGLQMQGLDSQYILVLVDGVPLVGRSAGTLDLNRISVGNIQQIEIVKGASSSLYGSDALGGVVNVITENPKQDWHGTLNYRAGTLNTHDLSLNTTYRNEKLKLSLFGNRYSSSGYDLTPQNALQTVEPYSNYTAQAKLAYSFSTATTASLSTRYYSQNQDYKASESLQGESNIEEWNAHFKLNHQFNSAWSSSLELYATQYQTDEYLNNEADASLYSNGFYDQRLLRPELRVRYQPNTQEAFIAGTGYNHETLDRTDFSENPTFNSAYVYLQYDATYFEKLNVIAGGRLDTHNVYTTQFSPKVALRYPISNALAIKTSVGRGFKAPAFRQLYFDFTNATVGYTVLGYQAVPTALAAMQERGEIANILIPVSTFDNELKPESSINLNLGVDYSFSKRLTFSLNVFRNSLTNLIDTRIIATKTNGQSVFSYTNINESYTQGLEFNFTANAIKNLSISGGYQLLYAKDKQAEAAFEAGQVYARSAANSSVFALQKSDYFGLYNRSRHSANLKLFYNIPQYRMNANLRATYRSKYGQSDTNGNGYLDRYDGFVSGYGILDFALTKKLGKHLQLGVGVDNLLDFTDAQNISNIPGRLLFGKLNYQF